jgi:O-methyltransferase involved in polyketide biosynthesis
MDLANVNARRELLDTFRSRARKALVMCEGLLIYLPVEQVGVFANDLAKVLGFQHWIVDIVSPALLEVIKKNTAAQITEGAAQLQFAPANGPQFFIRHGWTPIETRSVLKTASALKRLPFLLRLAALLPENPHQPGSRPWSGVILLKNSGAE